MCIILLRLTKYGHLDSLSSDTLMYSTYTVALVRNLIEIITKNEKKNIVCMCQGAHKQTCLKVNENH